MNRRSWLSGMLASLAWAVGFKGKTPAQEKASFARFELKVRNTVSRVLPTGGWIYEFDDMDDLIAGIDKIVKECNARGAYVTFSKTGDCEPVDDDENVLTVYYHQIMCPRSAGGYWGAWDDHNKLCRECYKKVGVGSKSEYYCDEHMPRPDWRPQRIPEIKERWYD